MSTSRRVEEIAIIVKELLQQVDIFTIGFDKNDIKLLEQAKEELLHDISYKESALPLILAMGGNYDSMEDKFKVRTIDVLIQLISLRKEYTESIIEKKKLEQIRKNNLKMLGF